MIIQFDGNSIQRIRQAVRYVEAQGNSTVNTNRRVRHRVPPAGDAYNHPWKLWTRQLSGSTQWACSEQDPDDVIGYPSGATAGRFYKPNNGQSGLTATSWATLASGTTVRLKLDINEGTCSGTITTAATSGTAYTDPALLWYEIGTITSGATGWTVAQKLNGDVDLTGAMIPAWYSGFSGDKKQVFWHDSGSGLAPSWAGTCV